MRLNYELWKNNELEIIKEFYLSAPREKLLELLPGRNWPQIMDKARRLNVKRIVRKTIFADLSPLLSGSVESAYWLGFLLADGHFNKKNGLRLSISNNDKNH